MTKKISLYILTALVVACSANNAMAWGRKGHGIVAEIAFTFLDSATRQNVQKVLGTTTIEDAANWMDEIRSDHHYDYMKEWHYVDIEKGQQYEATREGNIINELNTVINELEHKENLSEEQLRTDVLILFHLAGDMHQPLHAGYKSDKGGNSVDVLYHDRPSNLHKVWDTEIIESQGITANDCLKRLNHFDKEQIDQFKVINPENWMHEPRALLGKVYDYDGGIIDDKYIKRNVPVIEDQLLIAGIRLASVLEKCFKA